MKNRVTHRKIYETQDQLMEAVNGYFESMDKQCMPYTISGLCLAIGYSREMLLRRCYDPSIGSILMQARLIVEQQHELQILTTNRTTGPIFALKNLGWSERAFLDIGISASTPDNADALKWTVEVIAPGEDGNQNKNKAIVNQPDKKELEYHPPVQSDPAIASLDSIAPFEPVNDDRTVIDITPIEPSENKAPLKKQVKTDSYANPGSPIGATFSWLKDTSRDLPSTDQLDKPPTSINKKDVIRCKRSKDTYQFFPKGATPEPGVTATVDIPFKNEHLIVPRETFQWKRAS